MGRAKACMELMTNKKVRRVTFEKRRKGMEKKAQELSTLCGVRICFIILGSTDNDMPTEPKIWPENPEEIDCLINIYKSASLDDCRTRTTNFSLFYKDRRMKAEEDLAELRSKNLEAKLPTWDESYDCLSLEEMIQFDSFLNDKLEAVKARIHSMKSTQTCLAETRDNMTISSSYHPQENSYPYMIENQYLYRSRNSSAQYGILPPLPLSSFDPNGNVLEVPFQNTYNYNSMVNPQMMLWMNNGASTSINNPVISYDNVDQMCPVDQFNMEPAAAEHISSNSLGNNAVGNQFCYYIPTMQPMPVYLQYPLQQSTASQQMYGSQKNEDYGLSDFQPVNPK